ncbi:NAD(P)H nitroreductase [Nocardioides pantholopis]|uniref:NAD(P)H nitroreductase n=1 Tax=Nocardioides pantholopis TaxID=2483798 RepID=UPI000FD8FD36|nr:NAD(P)H nitroreductase [Nocardioides pantholopis]
MTSTAVPPAGRSRARRPPVDVVELACRAPSVHNSQPWRWRVGGTADAPTLDLYADRTRQHPTDPVGRNLVLSCGAALHHAQVAARGLGWAPAVTRRPDPADPDLLARLDLVPAPPSAEAGADLQALRERRTDRRRFTAWPVPAGRLEHLAAVAGAWGVRAVPVLDTANRFRVGMLVAEAVELQGADERHAGTGTGTDGLGGSDGLLVLAAETDAAPAWLRAGEALSALWLRAVRDGLAVVPLSQVVEVERTRSALEHDVLAGRGRPLLLVRVGWQEIARSTLPATGRRPVADVLLG